LCFYKVSSAIANVLVAGGPAAMLNLSYHFCGVALTGC
jgi:hypothetical protein